MAGSGAARARKPTSITVNQKVVEKYLRESLAAFHPRAGEMGQLAKTLNIKNIPTGVVLIWEDQKFLVTVAPETP